MCCGDGTVQVQCEEEKIDLCDPSPCENGGSCSIDSYTMMPVCTCPDGFIGKFCETEPLKVFANPCANSPCERGECIISGVEFECVCEPGWMGTLCEINPCEPSPCENNGSCSVIDNQPVCDCPGAFDGAFCQISPCEPSPCKNGAKCSINAKSQPVCSCNNGFYGEFCDFSYCDQFSCKNGQCIGTEGGAQCLCDDGFSGPACDVPIMFQSQKYTDLSCQNSDLELIFLIDSSGSARANSDFFRASKNWISEFLEFWNFDNLKVGLVTFAEDARVVLPLRNLPLQRVEKRLKSIFAQEYWFDFFLLIPIFIH